MVRHRVDLRLPGRVLSAPFVGSDRRAVASVRIDGGADVALFGSAADLRGLAGAAAAEQAEQLLAETEQLAAAGGAWASRGG